MTRGTAALALVMALAATTASAQSLTGAIAGTVKDAQGGALPGATISLLGRTGVASAITNAAGDYRFPAVEPGTYSLRVEMPGFRPQARDAVGLHAGERLTIDFLLSVGGLSESVDVSGQAPVVDVSSPQIRNGLSQDLLFNIPLDRFAVDALNATPGIVNSSAFGGTQAGNALLFDGVDIRNPQNGTAYIFYNYNIVQEVEVQGLGAPAEYGSFTGAVANTITRSGGNGFRGLFETRYSNDSLASDNVDRETAAANPALADPGQTRRLLDVTAQISGPIRKDRLFFFLNLQRYELRRDPSGQRTFEKEVSQRLNGKLTWQPSSSDHAMAMFQVDDFNIENAGGGAYDSDALAVDENSPERVWNLQWRHVFGSKSFGEAKYLGWASSYDDTPRVQKPAHYDVATGEPSVSNGHLYHGDVSRHQVNLSLSHFAEGFGHHDLKFGVEIARGRTHEHVELIGGLYYYDYAGAPYYAIGYIADQDARSERESLYAQDAWKPNARLTLTGGVRFDWIRGSSPATGTVYETRSLAPRIGAAFDVFGDRRSVLKASYGLYYEAPLTRMFSNALADRGETIYYSVPDLIESGRVAERLWTVARGIRQPRTDQATLAFERALSSDARFTIAVVRRVDRNIVGGVDSDDRWSAESVENLLTGDPITIYLPVRAGSPPTISNVDGFVFRDPSGGELGRLDARRKYEGLMLVLSKRLSRRWQAQASYTLARARGTVDNDLSRAFNFGLSTTNALVNAQGSLTYDIRHELKLLASYQIPRVDAVVSGYLRSISGTTYTPVQFQYSSSQPIRLESRGSRRNDTSTLLDLRIEKVFHPGRGSHRLGLYADVFNVFNANPVIETQAQVPSLEIPAVPTPILFGAPLAIAPARQIVLGARWSF